MDFTNSQDAVLALLGTIFGGAGLEIIRRALSKSKEREDSATAFRDELRTELTQLKTEMMTVERELDMWRLKYYELYETYLRVKFQYEAVTRQLSDHGLAPKDDLDLPLTPLDRDGEAKVESPKEDKR